MERIRTVTIVVEIDTNKGTYRRTFDNMDAAIQYYMWHAREYYLPLPSEYAPDEEE